MTRNSSASWKPTFNPLPPFLVNISSSSSTAPATTPPQNRVDHPIPAQLAQIQHDNLHLIVFRSFEHSTCLLRGWIFDLGVNIDSLGLWCLGMRCGRGRWRSVCCMHFSCVSLSGSWWQCTCDAAYNAVDFKIWGEVRKPCQGKEGGVCERHKGGLGCREVDLGEGSRVGSSSARQIRNP